ncbi:Zinc-binding oxidoreductase alcohol dehydrogenase [Ascochyta clinopodiicola]|nr:Zinc-binding oxidoreductase alcohol dehydrogenase [Ascochyta clinopodiicola]
MKALVTDHGLLARTANIFTGRSFGRGVKEVEVPKPILLENEILVRVRAAALNPIDVKFVDFIAPAGGIAGCDFAGVVEKIGRDVPQAWKVGDRVGGFVQGGIDKGRGAFAEYTTVEEDLVWKIPEGVSDEEASTYGVPAATAMQALYLNLDVPWFDVPSNSKQKETNNTIFIYAGSSSVGLFAIQLAKKAGFTVVTTASRHSFDLVKNYGADDVFDYHKSTAVQEIIKAHPNISRALDCFSEGGSTQFCAQVLQRGGGKVVTLLDTKAKVLGVEVKMIMSFQLLGRPFAWLPPVGPKYSASPEEREALVRFYLGLSKLAADVKAPPITLVNGGFRGILEGLDKIRAKQVSGSKIVVRL